MTPVPDMRRRGIRSSVSCMSATVAAAANARVPTASATAAWAPGDGGRQEEQPDRLRWLHMAAESGYG